MSGRSSRRGSFSLRQPPVVDIGCNCRRPKLFSIFSSSSSSSFRRGGSKPKSPNASSTSTTTAFTATTGGAGTATSTDSSWGPASFTTNSLFEEPAAAQQEQEQLEAVAVAVESAEPYEDFRESMVQMVVEKEIYAWDDLNDLLHQFLSLNSPRHHPLILHAFADLWTRNGLFSPPSPCQF
uniref:Transcription repressor n=1 Tax=Oryza barthii TaxID=65489 RepID=A0A0D3EWM7_9ORYZ